MVGGGLGGLGAAIAILLAGHNVTVLEAAPQIGEVGAGIQILPNSARVLQSWGVLDALEPFATKPSVCNFVGWKGNHLSEMDYWKYGEACGGVFWDFYRVNLHKCLLVSSLLLNPLWRLATQPRLECIRGLSSAKGTSQKYRTEPWN